MAPQTETQGSLFLSPTLLSILAIGLPIAYIVHQVFFHPLASIPGPLLARLSRLWMVKHALDGRMNRTMIEIHDKYGPLVRTGPNEVSVADLTAIKTIYGAGSKFIKSDWYSVWQGHRKFDLFPERNERVHGEQRRLVSRAYSMDSLKHLEPYINSTIAVFVSCLLQRSHQSIDMGNWVQLFAFDVIGEITFSKRFGFLDVGEDDGSFEQIERAMKSAAWIGQVPFLYWVHDALMPIIGNWLGISARHGSLRRFAVKEVEGRKDRGSERADILAQLFRVKEEKPGLMNDNAVVSMATSNIFAGSDTTAIATRSIIYRLLRNPECKRKLMEELEGRRAEGKVSDPITMAEAESMPYLQAVLWEGIRLHPSVGMSLPRVVPAGGITIARTYLPAGTIIGANPWVVHRNREVYGEDVEAFRPERWIERDNIHDMHRFFLAFGAGSRLCIGKNISWMEMSKLIPTLFLKFEMELVDPEKELETKCWWMVYQQGLHVRLRPRQV